MGDVTRKPSRIEAVLAAAFAFGASLHGIAAAPATEWAHDEFTNFAARIFGAAPKVEFVLPGEDSGYAEDFAALKDTDGYAVRRKGDVVVFVADCPKGHVNGVHRWLERNSDVVWPRPAGDLCLFTPRRAPLDSLQCDYRDVPSFRLRLFGGGVPDGETCRYLARNAVSPTANVEKQKGDALGECRRYGIIGGYCDVFGGGHDMETRWFPREEFFAEHPEWWMEIDGRRWTGAHSNFCETNPDFVKAYCASVLAKIAGLPQSVKIVSINMQDTRKTCTCANCLKPITLPDGSVVSSGDEAFASTRFFIFFNEVARAVAKARPDLKILQFAYHHLAIPPKVPVERNVIMKFCPYPRNMKESVLFGRTNAKWRRRADGWLANTPELYWREYYFCQCIFYPRPIADTAALDLREIARRGVKYVYTDSPGGHGDGDTIVEKYNLNRPAHEFYDMCAMEAWTVQRLFWDPSQDPEALRAEFLRRTFGPAAPHVAEFYRVLRDSWNAQDVWSTYRDNPSESAAQFIVSRGLEGRCRAALAAAEAAADRKERREWIVGMRGILARWIAEAPRQKPFKTASDMRIAVPDHSGKRTKALFLGDSLSDFDRGSNHVDRLQAKLDAACPNGVGLYNYAVRGDYISRLLDRLRGSYAPEIFTGIWDRQYDWAFVFLGHNDTRATSDTGFSEPLVSLKAVASGYEQLIGILRRKGIKRIIIVSPTSSDFELCSEKAEKKLAAVKAGKGGRSKGAVRFGDPALMEAFTKTVRGVAAAQGCEFLDLYSDMKDLPDKASYFRPTDGVHLSQKGHEYVAQKEFGYLQSSGSR